MRHERYISFCKFLVVGFRIIFLLCAPFFTTMEVFNTVEELTKKINQIRQAGFKIGFVPTMGALHQGHVSLVNLSQTEGNKTIVSIFVNPTQFNDKNDLARYPRNLEKDIEILKNNGCNLVFAPDEKEIYPEPDNRIFEFGTLASVMEGKFRPGHFNGVAQVVSRLFDIVKPDTAYFGNKDFQQLAIIREMVKITHSPVKITGCPIVREADGLAMSSRNALLETNFRKEAPIIYQTLKKASNGYKEKNVSEIKSWVIKTIEANGMLKVEYFDIVDKNSLVSLQTWPLKDSCIGCIAVFAGKIRLIDNVVFES